MNASNHEAVMLYKQEDYHGLLEQQQMLLWSVLSQTAKINPKKYGNKIYNDEIKVEFYSFQSDINKANSCPIRFICK